MRHHPPAVGTEGEDAAWTPEGGATSRALGAGDVGKVDVCLLLVRVLT